MPQFWHTSWAAVLIAPHMLRLNGSTNGKEKDKTPKCPAWLTTGRLGVFA